MITKKHIKIKYPHDIKGQEIATGSPQSVGISGTYVELIGSTNPQTLKDIYFYSGGDKSQEINSLPIIYEYIWSMAILGTLAKDGEKWYENLDDDGIVIQLIFHVSQTRFSIREVAANLNLLPPYKKIKGIADWFEPLMAFTKMAGEVVKATGLETTGKIISAISGMKMNSIPSSDEFPWFVKTFCCPVNEGFEPGIEWHIPKSLIRIIGNRLQGSLGIIFIEGTVSENSKDKEISIEIRAFLRDKQKNELFICPINEPVILQLSSPLNR